MIRLGFRSVIASAVLSCLSVAWAADKKPEPPPRQAPVGDALIPPSTPLVASDPYFSIWSAADRLTDDVTRHWTGKPHPLTSLVRIDGKPFRLMGSEPKDVPAAQQTKLEVLPTRTIYEFEAAGVKLSLVFMTATLPESLDYISRPVTYLTWTAAAADGKSHEVVVYFDAGAQIAVNTPDQQVEWGRDTVACLGSQSLEVLKIGSKDQPVLAKRGDDLRIDWGYLYTAAVKAKTTVAAAKACRDSFAAEGALPAYDERMPRAVQDESPVAASILDPMKVGEKPASRWLIVAYDDVYGLQYFQQNLRPYWRRLGAEAPELLKTAADDLEFLGRRCPALDKEMMDDLTKAGGEKYARIAALAYRQSFAAHKLVADANGQPLFFSKENFSNGCIGTVDVIYPAAPLIFLTSPALTKAMLVPVLDYASSPRWKFPFAPHDLGQYPHANGQRYGGGERTEENQMPVEETGNMLIMLAALAEMEGNADFAGQYWPVLEKWAEYLKAKGFDPENQLCTDDFAGHLAHNVNLSAKAIVALGAYGKLCAMRGDKAAADEYGKLARQFVARWVKEAADGDHYRLAFDRPGTWSQKYNIVWDRLLGLNLFPAEVLRQEMDFYKKTQNKFGIALDNRKAYTKLDWIVWTATLTGDRGDFEALVNPIYDMLNHTADRVPMTDWYSAETARKSGFQARSVVGGVFIKLLDDKNVWRKWSTRDLAKPKNWAPLPVAPTEAAK